MNSGLDFKAILATTRGFELSTASFWGAYRSPVPVPAPQPKRIHPFETFPIYEDTKVMTWCDYAVCRP